MANSRIGRVWPSLARPTSLQRKHKPRGMLKQEMATGTGYVRLGVGLGVGVGLGLVLGLGASAAAGVCGWMGERCWVGVGGCG